ATCVHAPSLAEEALADPPGAARRAPTGDAPGAVRTGRTRRRGVAPGTPARRKLDARPRPLHAPPPAAALAARLDPAGAGCRPAPGRGACAAPAVSLRAR